MGGGGLIISKMMASEADTSAVYCMVSARIFFHCKCEKTAAFAEMMYKSS